MERRREGGRVAPEDGVVCGHATPGGRILAAGDAAVHGGEEEEERRREDKRRSDGSSGLTREPDPEFYGPFG